MRALLVLLATLVLATLSPAARALNPLRITTNPGFGGVAVGNQFLFAGTSVDEGTELWRTDGTVAGTALLKDIYPGASSSFPSNFVVLGGKAYFAAATSPTSYSLWKSDGTPAGTTKVTDLPGVPALLQVAGPHVYFNLVVGSSIAVWRSDGTAAGTVELRNGFAFLADEFTAAAGKVFFSADDGIHGLELWVTDGTLPGTVLVRDINPGADDSDALPVGVDNLHAVNGFVVFGAYSPDLRLWRSDGTTAGTQPVGGPPLSGDFGPVLGGGMLVTGSDAGGNELWRSDGTVNGTFRVGDLSPGGLSSKPHDFVEFQGVAYFTATVGGAPALFRTDGTAGGTYQMQPTTSITKVWGGAGQDIFYRAQNAIWGVDPGFRITRKRFELAAPTDVYVWFRLAPNGLFTAIDKGGSTELWFVPAENPAGDDDGDGVPNGVEPGELLNPQAKDNDIFTKPRLFAMQQYRDFLGREGDAGGIQFYVGELNAGSVTREDIIASFLASPEFASGLPQITRLYFSFFNRIPDFGGLTFQVAALRSGAPLEAIAQNFYNSPEFTSRYGALTNDQYITLVYQNVLGRAPDTGGFAYYKNLLDSNTITKGQMMIGFSESPEFQQLSDNECWTVGVYVGLLRRTPEQDGLDFYVNLLDNGTPRANIIPGFFNSPEYHNRFLP